MDRIRKMGARQGTLDKQDLKNRLRSAQGNMRAIDEMIDGDVDCMDIVR